VRRRKPDGTFAVLPEGEAYFRHHESLWIPTIPRLIIKKVNDQWVSVRNETDYVSLAGIPHLTTATLRAGSSEEDQREAAIKIALAHIQGLTQMTASGRASHILFYDSEVYHAYDDTRPIRLHRQVTQFQAGVEPTVDTLLYRPPQGLTHHPRSCSGARPTATQTPSATAIAWCT